MPKIDRESLVSFPLETLAQLRCLSDAVVVVVVVVVVGVTLIPTYVGAKKFVEQKRKYQRGY
jgi:hypothetical protein